MSRIRWPFLTQLLGTRWKRLAHACCQSSSDRCCRRAFTNIFCLQAMLLSGESLKPSTDIHKCVVPRRPTPCFVTPPPRRVSRTDRGSSFSCRFAAVSLSNVGATACQYEALRYLSFPVQTLAKCAKVRQGYTYCTRDRVDSPRAPPFLFCAFFSLAATSPHWTRSPLRCSLCCCGAFLC